MKNFSILVLAMMIATPAHSAEFVAHMKTCHDAVWQLDEFKAIPNAGVSVHLGGFNDQEFYAYWIIDWDEVQVAGKCIMDRNVPKIRKITDFRKGQ